MEDILFETESNMEQAIANMEKRLTNIRAGRANPAILDEVTVMYYGAPTPLKQLANISIPEARQLCIKPFDKSCLGAIVKAIFEANIRQDANNNIKKLEIPEDDIKNGNEEVQKLIEKFNKTVDEKFKVKENELMSI